MKRIIIPKSWLTFNKHFLKINLPDQFLTPKDKNEYVFNINIPSRSPDVFFEKLFFNSISLPGAAVFNFTIPENSKYSYNSDGYLKNLYIEILDRDKKELVNSIKMNQPIKRPSDNISFNKLIVNFNDRLIFRYDNRKKQEQSSIEELEFNNISNGRIDISNANNLKKIKISQKLPITPKSSLYFDLLSIWNCKKLEEVDFTGIKLFNQGNLGICWYDSDYKGKREKDVRFFSLPESCRKLKIVLSDDSSLKLNYKCNVLFDSKYMPFEAYEMIQNSKARDPFFFPIQYQRKLKEVLQESKTFIDNKNGTYTIEYQEILDLLRKDYAKAVCDLFQLKIQKTPQIIYKDVPNKKNKIKQKI